VIAKRLTKEWRAGNVEAIRYLGRDVRALLTVSPFSGWRVTRSVESEPGIEIRYEFDGRGVEVVCNGFDIVNTVFVGRGAGEFLVDVAFEATRAEVLARFGVPEKSGLAPRIPGTRAKGPWDRFRLSDAVIHVQYKAGVDAIDMITLMIHSVVP
jgi:hypothetical protein